MATWDVIVVGSGLVGAAAARRLAEAGCRVLVIERGPAASEPAGSHLRNRADLRDDPDGYFAAIDGYFDYLDVDAPPARLPGAFTTSMFGGMGVVWTNNCPRAVAGVDRPDLLSEPDWDRYYGIAEQYLGVRVEEFDDSHRARSVAERLGRRLADQGRETIRLPLSGSRLDATHIRYVGPADVLGAVSSDIEVLPGRVEAVELEGGQATGVRVNGSAHRAHDVVVAAGAVETPVVLWRSGLRPAALGRHVSYHPVLMGQVVLDDELCAPDPNPDPLPRLGIPPTTDRPWFVMLLRDTNPFPVEPTDRDVRANRLLEVQAFAPVDPHPDNRLALTDSGAIEFNVPLRGADEQRRNAIEHDVDDLTERIGRYRAGCQPQWAPLGTPHMMGSCRMGTTDDGTSVTDPDGRVWGTENLYLATNGMIPTRLAVNPTLTTTALAVRTADRVARRRSNG